jgi:hypothetical protein
MQGRQAVCRRGICKLLQRARRDEPACAAAAPQQRQLLQPL